MPRFTGEVSTPMGTEHYLFYTNVNDDGDIVGCRVFAGERGDHESAIDLSEYFNQTISLDGDPDASRNIWNVSSIEAD